ncbi:MAG: recombinase family protein [Pirellulales bacterium]
MKFAKAKWSRQAKWTTYNVNSIIRRTIYRGFETNRKKVAKRKLRTGKSEYVWNDEAKIQTRESPHLRVVPDALWYRANEVVDGRRIKHRPARGDAHPLSGTARNRRGLLSGGVFICGICGSAMYSHGKKDGTFRCSGATKGECWNRGYCLREQFFPAILEAVVNEVLSLEGVRSAVLARVRELHETGGSVAAELKRLDKDEKRLVAALERERELAMVRARHEEVREQAGRKGKLPTAAKLLEHLEAAKGQLLGDEGKTYKEIAKECDLTKYHMENCARITRLMEEAGLPEPYSRLTEKPDHVPQWCSNHWLEAGRRKGGGRRRRAG